MNSLKQFCLNFLIDNGKFKKEYLKEQWMKDVIDNDSIIEQLEKYFIDFSEISKGNIKQIFHTLATYPLEEIVENAEIIGKLFNIKNQLKILEENKIICDYSNVHFEPQLSRLNDIVILNDIPEDKCIPYLSQFIPKSEKIEIVPIVDDVNLRTCETLKQLIEFERKLAINYHHIKIPNEEARLYSIPRVGDGIYDITITGEGIQSITLMFCVEKLTQPDKDGVWRLKEFNSPFKCLPTIPMGFSSIVLNIEGNVDNVELSYKCSNFNFEIRTNLFNTRHRISLNNGKTFEIQNGYFEIN